MVYICESQGQWSKIRGECQHFSTTIVPRTTTAPNLPNNLCPIHRIWEAVSHPAACHQAHREGTGCHCSGPVRHRQDSHILHIGPADPWHQCEGDAGPHLVTHEGAGCPDTEGRSTLFGVGQLGGVCSLFFFLCHSVSALFLVVDSLLWIFTLFLCLFIYFVLKVFIFSLTTNLASPSLTPPMVDFLSSNTKFYTGRDKATKPSFWCSLADSAMEKGVTK